ncbi:MAG: hypothetical protein ACK5LC_06845 [Coprobacillaceae bacterium]
MKKRKIVLSLTLSLLMMVIPINDVFAIQVAEDVVGEMIPPTEEPVTDFVVGNVQENGFSYIEPTNRYDDGIVTYYFVTSDVNYALLHGTLMDVTYEEQSYACEIIYTQIKDYTTTVHGVDISAAPIPSLKDNSTYFFDTGNFMDENYEYNYNLSGENKSIVGLHKASNGESESMFYKLPYPPGYSVASMVGLKARIMFNHNNTYIENIIFDGTNNDMLPIGGTGSVPKNRGEYFWYFSTNADNFVAKDVVLQNIGKDNNNSIARKNVAMNFYTPTSGQRNFEGVTIKNCKTKSGYGVVSFNQSANNYFKDLNIENLDTSGDIANHPSSYPIKIEHAATTYLPDANVANQKNIVFDGTLTLPESNSAYNAIYVQDYRYKNILLPATYRYALCKNSNGTAYGYGLRVYNHEVSPITSNSSLDLQTGYWLIQSDNDVVTLDKQMTDLNTLIQKLHTYTSIPEPKIKVISKEDKTIDAFTIPDFVSSYDNASTYTTHIVALLKNEITYPATNHASNGEDTEYIIFSPSVEGKTITLPTTNSSQVLLYNLDFKTTMNWTIEEAITGKIINFTKDNSGHNMFLKYTVDVTFINKEGEIVSFQTIDKEANATAPIDNDMDIPGYTFMGWSLSKDREAPFYQKEDIDIVNVSDDTIYYACYELKTDITYTVNYYIDGTTTPISDSKTVSNQTMGDVVTEQALDISGYIVDEKTKSLTLNATDNVINFYYKIGASITPGAPTTKPTITGNTTTVMTGDTLSLLGILCMGMISLYGIYKLKKKDM